MLRSLNEVRALRDPIKQSQCEFIIQDTPGMLLAKLSQKVAGAISGNSPVATAKELRLRCTSYSYPGPKLGQTELIINNHRRKLGTSQNKSGVWHCEIVEDFEGSVLNIIQAWIDLIHSNVLGTRLPSVAYASTCKILLGGDNAGGHVRNAKLQERKIILHGFYPIGYKVPDINPSSSEAITIGVNFNYDYWADEGLSLFSFGQ